MRYQRFFAWSIVFAASLGISYAAELNSAAVTYKLPNQTPWSKVDARGAQNAGSFVARPRPRLKNSAAEISMVDASEIREHMEVISSDRRTVGKVDRLEGSDRIKLTRESAPDGQHHHFIPISWVARVDQHVHLNKSGAEVISHWQHGQR